MADPMSIKMVVVGDCAVGKTCMLITKATGEHPEEYIPTVFDNTTIEIPDCEGTIRSLEMWDTPGQEDYDRLRPLVYPNTNVFVIVYSVVDSNEYGKDNVANKWIPELNNHAPGVPIILVGSKIDLRDGSREASSFEEGVELAERVDNKTNTVHGYMEISSLKNEGLNELFQEVVRLGLLHKTFIKKKSIKCLIF